MSADLHQGRWAGPDSSYRSLFTCDGWWGATVALVRAPLPEIGDDELKEEEAVGAFLRDAFEQLPGAPVQFGSTRTVGSITERRLVKAPGFAINVSYLEWVERHVVVVRWEQIKIKRGVGIAGIGADEKPVAFIAARKAAK